MKLSEKETLRRRGRDLRKGIVNSAALSREICERIMNWDWKDDELLFHRRRSGSERRK